MTVPIPLPSLLSEGLHPPLHEAFFFGVLKMHCKSFVNESFSVRIISNNKERRAAHGSKVWKPLVGNRNVVVRYNQSLVIKMRNTSLVPAPEFNVLQVSVNTPIHLNKRIFTLKVLVPLLTLKAMGFWKTETAYFFDIKKEKEQKRAKRKKKEFAVLF